ncbi:hypothetical protein Mth01_51930 [Sphaerimonospora thailandensis]|uniref:Uncharacterized protein n=1 Tax=Sphaerimonospora thailandensis TaxID=795644 RepID=A0A8J3RDV3_9ACTN|nr:hypothetical protein Mth01_51930 [Sphaerimonospora thailandensis]
MTDPSAVASFCVLSGIGVINQTAPMAAAITTSPEIIVRRKTRNPRRRRRVFGGAASPPAWTSGRPGSPNRIGTVSCLWSMEPPPRMGPLSPLSTRFPPKRPRTPMSWADEFHGKRWPAVLDNEPMATGGEAYPPAARTNGRIRYGTGVSRAITDDVRTTP